MIRFGVSPILLALALTAAAPPAFAQAFLSRYGFHLNAEHLSSDDERFVWDTDIGGEVDLIDYVAGRLMLLANYEAILGEEFRPFDPNQGNYTLRAAASARLSGVELAAVLHHVSRHLSDRAKRESIDWNMVGASATSEVTIGRLHVVGRGDVRGVVRKSAVDYRWEVDGDLATRFVLTPRVALVSGAGLRLLGVDESGGRGTQSGFRGEAGIGVTGQAGVVELFVAVERRIDPHPLEFGTHTWVTTGFRLLSR